MCMTRVGRGRSFVGKMTRVRRRQNLKRALVNVNTAFWLRFLLRFLALIAN